MALDLYVHCLWAWCQTYVCETLASKWFSMFSKNLGHGLWHWVLTLLVWGTLTCACTHMCVYLPVPFVLLQGPLKANWHDPFYKWERRYLAPGQNNWQTVDPGFKLRLSASTANTPTYPTLLHTTDSLASTFSSLLPLIPVE